MNQQHITYSSALINLLNTSFQTATGYICLYLCITISLHYVALYAGAVPNAAVGLANTTISILITPIAVGLNESLNLHTAQALGNSKIKLAKKYLTLNVYLLFILMIPTSLILYALKYPLKYTIAEDRDETSDVAWRYLLWLIPANIIAFQFEGFKTYMIAYKITYPFPFIHLGTTLFHWFLCWLLIAHYRLGILGAGIAVLSTECLNFIGLGLFVTFSQLKHTVFSGINLYINTDMKGLIISYLKQSLPIIAHYYAALFIFFMLTFVALYLGTYEMNAQLAITNTINIIYRYSISLSMALMSYVGSEMGMGNIESAQKYVIVSVVIQITVIVIFQLLLTYFKQDWLDFYTDDYTTQSIMNDCFNWMVYGVFYIDGLQGSISGALKGIGKVNLVAYSTLIAYYVLCIPLTMYLVFQWGLNQGVVGIWQAFGTSNGLLLLLYVIALLTSNWHKQSEIIQSRISLQHKMQQVVPEQQQFMINN